MKYIAEFWDTKKECHIYVDVACMLSTRSGGRIAAVCVGNGLFEPVTSICPHYGFHLELCRVFPRKFALDDERDTVSSLMPFAIEKDAPAK
jgi:hypothetical protein